ncbi:hypothetical protein EST38_g13836 [Candolleomyces aberdarensis]|uniref:Uncharacterized protein n=1 Tax=Candolleomyces aberdarensis TaxID=2316362 RepID=A0A4V1Q1L6_9AGAR|nr:hypothetical protein EST38_g13836 [Candolleomyces aberdarensis]
MTSSRSSSPDTTASIDPMLLLAGRARARTFSDPDGPGSDDIDENDGFLTGPVGTISTVAPPLIFNMSQADFIARGRALKKQRTLSPRSEEDLEVFLHSPAGADHMLRVFLGLLESQDLLVSIAAGTAYTIPEDVKDSLLKYSQVYILSPKLLHYKRKTSATTVLAAMRYLGVSGIPPEHDVGRAEVVLKTITKALTDARHHIKEQISASLKADAAAADIGSVAYACVSGSKTKPTTGTFLRVAFLRWVMIHYPNSIKNFWDEVDRQLDGFRKQFKTPLERENALQEILDQDIKKYGSAVVDCPPIPADRVEDWVKTVDSYASNTVSL